MTIDLDLETRLALVDELKKHIPEGEQKRIGIEVARALGNADSTGESKLSRLLNKHQEAIEQLLGPDRAETVLRAICNELKLDMAELLRAARRAAGQRPRAAPDRHPAWQQLGEAAPWVDKVPGLQNGMETLRAALSAYGQHVVWLVGPAGSGKSARLWRAQEAQIGRLIAKVPDDAGPDAVWLVDEPADPDAWIAGAARCKARLVIATRAARQLRDGQSQLKLSAWTQAEAESFLGQLGAARGAGAAAVDLELIADKLAVLRGGWTPLDLGHLIRLLIDEPALLEQDSSDRELRIRAALHGMLRRAELSADREQLWIERGRQACAVASAAAARGSSDGRPIGPISEAALREALAELAGVMVGREGGTPLRLILERARRESRKDESGKGGKGERDKGNIKQVLDKMDAWARSPSSDDLIELLVELGAWRRAEGGSLVPSDDELALSLAAERLDDDWMWRRLRDTLADPEWAIARIGWAPYFGRVVERLDELLATDAAVHVGAIELAVALVALAREVPRPDQVERAVCSAARFLACETLVRIGLSPIPSLREVAKSASRRHLRTLPPVTVASTRSELEQRCTEGTRRVVRAADGLAEDGPEWLRAPMGGTLPDWFTYARLMPWQALSALQDPAGRELLQAAVPLLGERPDWEAVVMDHAADGHTWARAVATGDVENIQVTLDLVSIRGLLRALGRWPAPGDLQRHDQALAIVLDWLPHGNDAVRPQLHTRVVRAIVDFVRRHPDRPLPNVWSLQRHEARWREALDQAAAVHHIRTWFDGEREDLARAVTDASTSSSLGAAPGRLPTAIANGIARVLRLGEVLHRHGVPAPLRGLLEQTEARPHIDRTSVEWQLGVGAADALLRLRDAASLRSLREPYRSARYDAVSSALSSKNHDEETVLWIADHLEERYDEVLESIVGRPERREVARRWALDASSSFRRHAAAVWLLRHPAAGEVEHVRWLLTDLAVKDSLHYVKPALAHPHEAVGAAAIALLPRALDQLGDGADLVAVVQRSFDPWPGHAEPWFAMTALARYLDEVNASGRASSPDSIRTLIELAQRYFASASEEEVWRVASVVCSSLAAAALRLGLASLASWVRDPLGASADAPVAALRIAMVRAGIINGLRQFGKDGADLDPEVLQAVADTGDSTTAIWACSLLLEREALTEAQLLAEWSAVSDAVLVEQDTAPARFYAVQDRLRRQAPRELARTLADRLLALSPELRRFGVPQISQVAVLDAGQVVRLSPLFE